MVVYVTAAAMEIPAPSESNFECSIEYDPDTFFPEKKDRAHTVQTAIRDIFDNSWNRICRDHLGKLSYEG